MDRRELRANSGPTPSEAMNSSSFNNASIHLNASIQLLAELVSRHLAAAGWAIWSLDPMTGTLAASSSGGGAIAHSPFLVPVPESRMAGESRLLCYPLRADGTILGTLAFLVPGRPPADANLAAVEQFVSAIEKLYYLPFTTEWLFSKLNQIETNLAASKISARLHALTEEVPIETSLEMVNRVVENVLASLRLPSVLKQYHGEAERELRKREVAQKAKQWLQSAHGLTEEQAHVHLRSVSRKRGKRIEEIAQELLLSADTPGRQTNE